MDWFVRIAVTLAVIICYPLTVGLGVEAFLPIEKINYDKCYQTYPVEPTKTNDGTSSAQLAQSPNKSYDEQQNCIEVQKKDLENPSTRNFLVIGVLGILAILSGLVYVEVVNEPVRQGLVLGGVISVIYANMRFGDSEVDMRWRFVSALITLLAVIIVSRRWFGAAKKK